MKKLILPLLIAVLYPLTGNAASLSVDANGMIINTTPTKFKAGKLMVCDAAGNNCVEVTSSAPSDTAFAASWNGATTIAPSKNAIYDWAHLFDTDDDGKPNVLDLAAGIPKTNASGVLSLAVPGTDYVASLAGLWTKTARVDAGGNDATGVIGDPSKPFLTVQGAINAVQIASPGNGNEYLIDVGNNGSSEDVTTSLTIIAFVSSSPYIGRTFSSLTFTAPSSPVTVVGLNCNLGFINTATTEITEIILFASKVDDIDTSDGPVFIYTPYGDGIIEGNVVAGGEITIWAANVGNNNISAPGFEIQLFNCRAVNMSTTTGAYNMPVIDSAGSTVKAYNSLIGSVTAADSLSLIDSRVLGANAASSTTYSDRMLAGDDTAYDPTSWNGNTRTPTKNAVRDKIESLSVGDASTNTATSVDSEAAVFSGTGGKTLKRATATGIAKLTSGVLSAATAGTDYFVPEHASQLYVYDDFINNTITVFTGGTTGGTAPASATGDIGRPGLKTLVTSTSASGASYIWDANSIMWVFSGGEAVYETSVKVVTLSDGTETFTVRCGWNDSQTADGADGVYFRYTHSENSGRWVLVARSNSVETATNSTATVPANSWDRLRIVVNAAGTSAEGFVDGVSIGTVASNIPITQARATGMTTGIVKSAGTTSRNIVVDYIMVKQAFTAAR